MTKSETGSNRRMTAVVEGYQVLEALHQELDAAQRDVEAATGGRPICVANCGKCCENTVPGAMGIEVNYLLSHLAVLPKSKEIRDRALGWMAQPHPGLKLHEKIKGRPYRQEEQAELAEDQHTLQKGGCPFLAADKTCMVHAVRPLVCRGYGVTLSADSFCPRPLDPTETPERRKAIAPNGPRGTRIQGLKTLLTKHLQKNAPDLLARSWLPGLIARELDKEGLLALQKEGKIADIKLAMSTQAPRLWRDQPEEDTIPLMEVAHA